MRGTSGFEGGKGLFYRHIRPFFGRVHLTSQWCQNTKGGKLWQNLLYNVDPPLQEILQRMKIDIRLRRYRSVTLGCLPSHLKKNNSDLEQNETVRYRNCHSNKRQSSLHKHKHIFMIMYLLSTNIVVPYHWYYNIEIKLSGDPLLVDVCVTSLSNGSIEKFIMGCC